MKEDTIQIIFEDESSEPRSAHEALEECQIVLKRILDAGLLCGAEEQRMVDGKVQRPLYGCAVRAQQHTSNILGKPRNADSIDL